MKQLFFIFLVFLFSTVSAQNSGDSKFSDRLFKGGSFGLMFGSVTNIEISPFVGYNVTDEFGVGLKGSYQFMKADYTDGLYYYNYKTTLYGGGPFARYFIIDELFLYAELEMLSLETDYFDRLDIYDDNVNRFIYTSAFVGAGYAQRSGGKSFFYIMLLYNLNDSSNSPYPDPYVIRAGYNF